MNKAANWTTVAADATVVFNESGTGNGMGCAFFAPTYLPDFARYVAVCSNTASATFRLQFFQAAHLSGPWISDFVEPTPTPFSGPPWNLRNGCIRGFPSFIPSSYNLVSSSPLTAKVTVIHDCDYTQQEHHVEARAPYSIQSLVVTITSGGPGADLLLVHAGLH